MHECVCVFAQVSASRMVAGDEDALMASGMMGGEGATQAVAEMAKAKVRGACMPVGEHAGRPGRALRPLCSTTCFF